VAQRNALGADDCSEAIGAALADKYAAAVNAHDTSSFPDIHAESYIQNSGRSPSGLAAQIELFKRIFALMPDLRMRVEDRIVAGNKVVSRNTFSATHNQTIRASRRRESFYFPYHRYLACRKREVCRTLGCHRYSGGAEETAR
jgi:predicted SnoaL-like aldol condensation-catalyzing enzyme